MKVNKIISACILLCVLTGCKNVEGEIADRSVTHTNNPTASALSIGVDENYTAPVKYEDEHAQLWAQQCMGSFYDTGITKLSEGESTENAAGYALYDINGDGEAELLIFDGKSVTFCTRANRLLGKVAADDINKILISTDDGVYAYSEIEDSILTFATTGAKLNIANNKATLYDVDSKQKDIKANEIELGTVDLDKLHNGDYEYIPLELNYLYVTDAKDYAVEIKTQFYNAYMTWKEKFAL